MKKLAIIVLLIVMLSALAACTILQPNGSDNSDKTNQPETPGNPTEQSVVVTFLSGQGVFADNKTAIDVKADANGKVKIESEPHKDGHAFCGWYNGETKFDPSSKYTQSQTFTAKYVSGGDNSVYSALFDEKSVVGIDINMSHAEWKKLNQDFVEFEHKFGDEIRGKSPIYRLANSVTISIDSGNGVLNYYFEEVGIRMKGNTSRHEFYNDNGFFNNVHLKLSFKQTFDDPEDGYKTEELKVWTEENKRAERKARTLGGMEKIDIKYNSCADETYVRELYAMKMFRDNGIYAPNITLCSLTALEKNTTKKNMGIYRIHEPVDEAFITRNIEKKVGDLYKCTWGSAGPADLTNYNLENRVGVEDELKGEFYTYDKKTNKKKDKVTGLRDFSSIKNFITAINGSSPDFESLIDTDYFAMFESINYILGNPDCIRNNYNNYYLYFRADGKAIIIPYDYDRCLGITKDWNPREANMYVAPFTRTTTGNLQSNPLYIKLIDKGASTADGSVLMRYRQNLITLSAAKAFTATTFNAYKDNYKSKYSKYTATAINTNKVAFDDRNTGNVAYDVYIQAKLQTLNNNINNYNP